MKKRAKAEWDRQENELKQQKAAAAASEAALQERMERKMAEQQVAAELLLNTTVGEWEQKVEAERDVTAEVRFQAQTEKSELQAQHVKEIEAKDEQLLALDLQHEVCVGLPPTNSNHDKNVWPHQQAAMDELRAQHEKDIEHTIVETRKENTKVMLEARQKYTEEAIHRAKLYNRVMELQGNIRVLCRVRPILPHELKKGSDLAKDCTEFPVENDIIINDDDEMSHRFQFDSTFGPDSTQEQVYKRRIE